MLQRLINTYKIKLIDYKTRYKLTNEYYLICIRLGVKIDIE